MSITDRAMPDRGGDRLATLIQCATPSVPGIAAVAVDEPHRRDENQTL